jgi:hypothetical protein
LHFVSISLLHLINTHRPAGSTNEGRATTIPIEQVNDLAGHKSMAMTKRYDHPNEERYGAAIEALEEAGKTGKAEALAAARWKQTE